ncbi:MAG: DUF5688 family protein [Clostridium sp.]|nr:DUF5688 family protein [Acetatifactor muris]MCM1527214.1 DUF5688 family protein [Bacteroides sp.]MCM1562461.1 DUF5688 family protein [Clostridium sp.]
MVNSKKSINSDAICPDIRDFAEMVSRAVSERLGERCQVKLQEVIKNNGVVLQGMVILAEDQNLSPTIYLNYFLEMYRSGTSLDHIVQVILKIYEEETPKTGIDMSFFRNFEAVSPQICYKLVNRERNRALLERIPHIEFLDLCICFFYAWRDETVGSGSILIHNDHMDIWGCSTETLLKLAQENTPRIFPWKLYDMEELLSEFMACGEAQTRSESRPKHEKQSESRTETRDRSSATSAEPQGFLHVLCNEQRSVGAACMIYPRVLRQVAEQWEDDLYILPSSIHEVLLLPAGGTEDTGQLLAMVREVNRTQVAPEEVLSDNLYFYDRSANRVEVIGDGSSSQ